MEALSAALKYGIKTLDQQKAMVELIGSNEEHQ